MKIKSPSFKDNERIPHKFTCDGENVSPALSWSDIPAGTKNLALIMDDPDIPDFVKEKRGIEEFVHWVVWNIPADSLGLDEDSVPSGAVQGPHSGGINKYTGPCPPDREHRYFFRLYALDEILNIPASSTKYDLIKAMEGHVLDMAESMGKYDRIK